MNRKELERIESILKENGYRKVDSPMHCNADYYWWKAFGKDCNHYEEGRSLYQVLLKKMLLSRLKILEFRLKR